MHIYVTRHGITEFNKRDQICGISDIPLAPEGITQARELAKEVAKHTEIERILCSPLYRARQTADPSAELLNLPVEIDERLTEWNYGSFEGKNRHTQGFSETKAEFGVPMPDGGESVFLLVQRTYNLLDDVKKSGKNTLIVSHGGICRVIDSYFSPMTVDRFMSFFMGNCELRKYTV